jgi:hypothetical protein
MANIDANADASGWVILTRLVEATLSIKPYAVAVYVFQTLFTTIFDALFLNQMCNHSSDK